MCEAKPGPRCAADTCENASLAAFEYAEVHPDGPDLDPLAAAQARFASDDPVNVADPTPERGPYDIPAHRLDEAKAQIAKANRRLEKAGIEERFTYDVETYVETRERQDDFGYSRIEHVERVRLTLNQPDISYGGWTFVASLDSTESGIIARTAPGQSLDGWRPDAQGCDHCGRARHRSSTYIVRNADGEKRQIGSGCLRPFLGVKPAGLWALEYDINLTKDTDDFAGSTSDTHAGPSVTPTRELIAVALAASDGGKSYLSNTKAMEWERQSTASTTQWALYGAEHTREAAAKQAAIRERAQEYLEDGTVDAVLAAGQNIDGDDDYPTNLRVALAGEYVGARHSALAISSIGVWRRGQEREARKVAFAPGYAALVGEKIAGMKATVTKVSQIPNPYQYNAVNTLVLFRTEAGHQVKWFASGAKDIEVGATGVFTGGSVKQHDTYQGVDQTVVTRVKFAE